MLRLATPLLLLATAHGALELTEDNWNSALAGKSLCEKHGVQGYPTIKTLSGPDDLDGEKYEGGRDLDSLRKHAESLGPPCTVDAKENCSPEDLKLLEKYAAMSQQRRDAKVVKLTNALKKLKAELQPQIKLLTAATPKK